MAPGSAAHEGDEPARTRGCGRDETCDELSDDPEHDAIRDRSGRRFPAHLTWAGKPDYFSMQPYWWGWHHIAWYFDVEGNAPDHIYYHRPKPIGWRRL